MNKFRGAMNLGRYVIRDVLPSMMPVWADRVNTVLIHALGIPALPRLRIEFRVITRSVDIGL